jgi:hypothetical protein
VDVNGDAPVSSTPVACATTLTRRPQRHPGADASRPLSRPPQSRPPVCTQASGLARLGLGTNAQLQEGADSVLQTQVVGSQLKQWPATKGEL